MLHSAHKFWHAIMLATDIEVCRNSNSLYFSDHLFDLHIGCRLNLHDTCICSGVLACINLFGSI